ncbi:conserved Plasmodium protein, unknown function [Plasmodium sp. gorilla clade G3]|nr:conserved Plasmodium protein, unknown function [Plasmodium sp. gorilla clade G3]
MKSLYQMNHIGHPFMYPKIDITKMNKTNNQNFPNKTYNSNISTNTNTTKKSYGTSLNYIKKDDSSKNSIYNNYEYLDASHLEMLDLNKNINNILPKPMKPSLDLESLCKETTSTMKKSKIHSMQSREDQNKNVKHFYEMGTPQIIGTYIQPLHHNPNSFNQNNFPKNHMFPLPPASPFFQPPNFRTNLTQASSTFIPLQHANKSTNIYGMPSYLIPENKPQNLTVTVVPNKDKDFLEKEAKHLKALLDSSSKGIVNSTPDYQKIQPSSLSNYNDKESDFSFGKNDNSEHAEYSEQNCNYENDTENNYNSFVNEFYDPQNSISYNNVNEFLKNSNQKNQEHSFRLESNEEVIRKVHKEFTCSKRTSLNKINILNQNYKDEGEQQQENETKNNMNMQKRDEERQTMKKDSSIPKRTQLAKKKVHPNNTNNSVLKKHEPSTCFKNPKTYINIRLGKPKKLYITNSSDPIDKKLSEWHNTHNSQIGWKKYRRGVYTFGKTEVILSLVHDKIIVKKINGKHIKDNLLTVEKFVSLNELYEIQQEENDNILRKKGVKFFNF